MGNKIPSDKHNLLIAPDGNKKLQERLAKGEPRYSKRKDIRDGTLATEQGLDTTKQDPTLRGVRVWYISEFTAEGKAKASICLDCMQAIPVGTKVIPGVTPMREDRPDLDLRLLDVIAYFVCDACHKKQQDEQYVGEQESALVDQYGENLGERRADMLLQLRTARMTLNAYEWIKNAKLRGLTYKTVDGA